MGQQTFGGIAVFLVFALAYAYFALVINLIAKKTGHKDIAWMGWIPLIQLYPFVLSAGKPGWWIVLLFIPLAGIVFGIILWWKISEARGKPGWLSLLLLVPAVNIIVPGYLAFSQ